MPDLTLAPLPNVPNSADTINSILGIQQKQQALQTGAYQQQSAESKASSDVRSNAQAQNIANYLANPANKGKKAADMKDDLISIGVEKGQAAYDKQLNIE